ncbi:endonuclease/exonuclease/phosphatase family protein [Bacillus tianshenii]|uniref:endonuclease/exonuclease/phosphatase family protein n=1 Tax=Sutcliffiella tianshenii TaxID=1463404 RepID=UPI001CD1F62E|nr:endonuclease/exonuclease/phosphatase family protein [Bacillus tianshenii]MCA1320382.1 endonuclease/exonuclease/phosphatase family protein [Bacillus tianshenii]
MNLLTLNCHSWQEENQMEKIQHLAQTIKEKAYDVIALQEVSQSIDAPLVRENIKENNYGLVLLQELEKLGVQDYQLVWDFAHMGYDTYEEGLAILTRLPLVKSHSFFVSKGTDTDYWKTRKIVGVTVEYAGRELSFYTCHLGWWTDEEEPARYQIEQLLHEAKGCGTPFFLMGDFNNSAHIKGEGYELLTVEHGLHDTYLLAEEQDSGITVRGKIAGWDDNKQDLRIDLILASDQVDVASSQVIFNGENKEVVSDHFGVEVRVRL